MPLTKKQMMYGGVLVLAAGGFLWDRMGPGASTADGSTAAVKSADAVPPAAAKPGSTPAARTTLPNREAIGIRLKAVAASHAVEADQPPNAFAVPPTWLPEKANAAKPAAVDDGLETAKTFSTKHALNAVMVRTRSGYAIVDGQGVFIGQVVDKFSLLKVTNDSALFGHDAVRVLLRLDGKPAVWKETAAGTARGD